jgi:predicted dehydrogenase
MEKTVGIGIIGCGDIFDTYMTNSSLFPNIKVVGISDINTETAQKKSTQYAIPTFKVYDLLQHPDVQIVLNITPPLHHAAVGLSVLHSGKHLYTEKPLATSLTDALELVRVAKTKDIRIGCAPDTFLGGWQQAMRQLIDDGEIGTINAGTAFMQNGGHESWHPNPDFFYKPGGGPLFDMGPYYITSLINLLGPVKTVIGQAKISKPMREIGSGPRKGQQISVDVATNIHGILEFESGASILLSTSFDVLAHEHNPIEIYGSKGTLIGADPNEFEGGILIGKSADKWTAPDINFSFHDKDYRMIGLADMADAIMTGRKHRANEAVALHVVEIMEAILESARTGQRVHCQYPCLRPEPMVPGHTISLGG